MEKGHEATPKRQDSERFGLISQSSSAVSTRQHAEGAQGGARQSSCGSCRFARAPGRERAALIADRLGYLDAVGACWRSRRISACGCLIAKLESPLWTLATATRHSPYENDLLALSNLYGRPAAHTTDGRLHPRGGGAGRTCDPARTSRDLFLRLAESNGSPTLIRGASIRADPVAPWPRTRRRLPVSIFERDGPPYYNSRVCWTPTAGRGRLSQEPLPRAGFRRILFRPGDTGFKVWKTATGARRRHLLGPVVTGNRAPMMLQGARC